MHFYAYYYILLSCIYSVSISRCIEDVKCSLGKNSAIGGESELRKSYSDRVSEVLKCRETISLQAEKMSTLRMDLQDKNETIAELRHVIHLMSVEGSLNNNVNSSQR